VLAVWDVEGLIEQVEDVGVLEHAFDGHCPVVVVRVLRQRAECRPVVGERVGGVSDHQGGAISSPKQRGTGQSPFAMSALRSSKAGAACRRQMASCRQVSRGYPSKIAHRSRFATGSSPCSSTSSKAWSAWICPSAHTPAVRGVACQPEQRSHEFVTEELVVAGDRAIVRWLHRWVDLDVTSGHVRGVDIFRVRDGKVAEKLSYVKG
jgi:hypothetical protein